MWAPFPRIRSAKRRADSPIGTASMVIIALAAGGEIFARIVRDARPLLVNRFNVLRLCAAFIGILACYWIVHRWHVERVAGQEWNLETDIFAGAEDVALVCRRLFDSLLTKPPEPCVIILRRNGGFVEELVRKSVLQPWPGIVEYSMRKRTATQKSTDGLYNVKLLLIISKTIVN